MACRSLRLARCACALVALSGCAPQSPPEARTPGTPLRILAINDFHGALETNREVKGRPAGGAAVLGSWMKDAARGMEDRTFYVSAGDLVGASPAVSALLQDEPTISFLGLLGNGQCRAGIPPSPLCNVVGTLGNHEFDEGKDEIARLLGGGNHPKGPFLDPVWRGASFPVVCANIVEEPTGRTLFPPYTIQEASGVRIAFVGATTKTTPRIVLPEGIAGLRFLDEAEAVNRCVPEIVRSGVRAIVLLLHEGDRQEPYDGPTRPGAGALRGETPRIVGRLDGEIDIVISGHAHTFTNALLPNRDGHAVLVTQAWGNGTAFADIDFSVDPRTGDVASKSARIVTTWADEGPGKHPDRAVAALVAGAEARTAPLTRVPVARTREAISRKAGDGGESPLGSLIADAHRAAMRTEIAFTNPGGIRADLPAGTITWGDAFRAQPWGNTLVRMELTGRQVRDALEEQWRRPGPGTMLQVSGLRYSWDPERPRGRRVTGMEVNGVPLDPARTYTVAMNSYLAAGGDGFRIFTQGTGRVVGPSDLDALVEYLESLPRPVRPPGSGRIRRSSHPPGG